MSALEVLENFTLENLPDLDVVVEGALERLSDAQLPVINTNFKRPLVIGSVNALSTGRIIFSNQDAVFADESSFMAALDNISEIDGAVLVSASGGKHAISIAKELKGRGVDAYLMTNNPEAPAKEFFESDRVLVFPRNREPYTYNTSTYLGMILAHTEKSAGDILEFIKESVEPKLLRNFEDFDSYTFIVPPEFADLRGMLRTKFDELFGPHVLGRIFTSEEVKHAKTVVNSGAELFISFGTENKHFGLPKNRLNLPLPEGAGAGEVLAVSYFVVGKIQKSHPAYFKNSIEEYTKQASELFGHAINPIVE